MVAIPAPPADVTPPPAPPTVKRWRILQGGLVATVVILASVFAFWFVTGSGPFADIQPSRWALDMTQATDLQARGTNGTGVTLCIVDTGVDLSHQELRHVRLRAWRDFVNGRSQPYDDEGHGTAMAGIVFARGRLMGVAPDANLIAVKAIAASGSGTDTQIANAITFCTDPNGDGDSSDGAHVISLSLGGRSLPFLRNSAAESAANQAMDLGVIVVAAAGNDGRTDDGDVESPARVARVIAVGAVDRGGVIAPFSSMGSGADGVPPAERTDPNRKPEVTAPGVEIAAPLTGDSYGYVSGTSPAAALVSGIVALLLDDHPEYRHDGTRLLAFKTALMQGACGCSRTSVPHDDHYGYGIVRSFATEALL